MVRKIKPQRAKRNTESCYFSLSIPLCTLCPLWFSETLFRRYKKSPGVSSLQREISMAQYYPTGNLITTRHAANSTTRHHRMLRQICGSLCNSRVHGSDRSCIQGVPLDIKIYAPEQMFNVWDAITPPFNHFDLIIQSFHKSTRLPVDKVVCDFMSSRAHSHLLMEAAMSPLTEPDLRFSLIRLFGRTALPFIV